MVNNFLTCSDCSGTQWLLHLTSSSSWSSTWLWAALVATFQVITLSDWWIAQKTRILIGGWLRNTTFWLAESSENAHSDRRIVLKIRILIGGWLRKHASWLEDGSESTPSDWWMARKTLILIEGLFWKTHSDWWRAQKKTPSDWRIVLRTFWCWWVWKRAFWLVDGSENIDSDWRTIFDAICMIGQDTGSGWSITLSTLSLKIPFGLFSCFRPNNE